MFLQAMHAWVPCLLLFLSLGYAQHYTFPAPQRVLNDSTITASAAYGGNSVCTPVLVLISSSPTSCLTLFNTETKVSKSLPCASELVGASSLLCLSTYCYAVNSNNPNVIVFDYTGAVLYTWGEYMLYPTGIAVYQGYWADEIAVYDEGAAALYFYARYTPVTASTDAELFSNISFPHGAPPAGMFWHQEGVLIMVDDGQSQVIAYELDAAWWQSPTDSYNTYDYGPTFGAVLYLAGDFYGRAFVYDPTCSCIQILDQAEQNIIGSIQFSGYVNIKSISHSRDFVYVVDPDGILKYSNRQTVTFEASNTNVTCLSNGASVVVNVEGGIYPLTYRVDPDNLLLSVDPGNFDYPYTYFSNDTFENLLNIPPVAFSYPMFIDALGPSVGISFYYGTAAKYAIANSTTFLPHSGNASLQILFTYSSSKTEGIEIACGSSCMSSSKYHFIQFWINMGNGGQNISVLIGTYEVMKIDYTFPHNTWKFISIDLAHGTTDNANYLAFSSSSTSTTQNPFYIDDVVLVPYNSSMHYVSVEDFCGNRDEYDLKITQDYAFTVSLAVLNDATCSTRDNSPVLAADGKAVVIMQNGHGPFTYDWNFPTGMGVGSTLYNISSAWSTITVYDNALNTSWKDASSDPSIIMQDSTHYHSAPYGFSFASTVSGMLFMFNSPAMLSSDDYPRMEFWVNGGATGGQTVNIVLYEYSNSVTSFIPLYQLIGMDILPGGNAWVKATLYIDPGINFNSIIIQSPGGQPRIYFDDLVLVSQNVITVTDNTGCAVGVDRMTVLAPPALVGSQSVTHAKCYGSQDGAISVSVSGGVPPYIYHWSVPQVTSPVATDLNGSTEVTCDVTDAHGCALPQFRTTILQPPQLSFYNRTVPITCPGGKGQISAWVSGGSGPYTYQWSSIFGVPDRVPQPEPVSLFSDSAADSYTLSGNLSCNGASLTTPSHSGYCAVQKNSGAPVILSGSFSSFVGIDFWVYVPDSADIPKLQIVLSRNGVVLLTQLVSGLATITHGVWTEVYVNISSPALNSATEFKLTSTTPTSAISPVLVDDIVGVPSAASSVGINVYTGVSSVVDVLATLYSLTVVDANGCFNTIQWDVQEPDPITISYEMTSPSSSSNDGSVMLEVTGGTPPYSYHWANGQTGKTLFDLAVGTYTVEVIDGNGCSAVTTVLVDYSGARSLLQFNKSLSSGLSAVVVVGAVLAAFAIIMVLKYIAFFTTIGHAYSGLVIFGVLVGYVAAILLLVKPSDAVCTAFPWLLGVSFSIVYGCVFVKTLYSIIIWKKGEAASPAPLHIYSVLKVVLTAVAIEIILLIVWTAVDPPKVHQVKVVNNRLENQCAGDHNYFWIIFTSLNGAWLLVGTVLSLISRNVASRIADSSGAPFATYNLLILLVIAVPLDVLLNNVPGSRVVVQVAIIVMALSFTMFILFFPVWQEILLPDKLSTENVSRSSNSSRSSSASMGGVSVSMSNSAGLHTPPRTPPHTPPSLRRVSPKEPVRANLGIDSESHSSS